MIELHELEMELTLQQLHLERTIREMVAAFNGRADVLERIGKHETNIDHSDSVNDDRLRVGEVSKGHAPSRRHGAT